MSYISLKEIPTEQYHFAAADGSIHQLIDGDFKQCYQWINHDGYRHVRIHSGNKNKTAHRLVCAAYHGLPPDIISYLDHAFTKKRHERKHCRPEKKKLSQKVSVHQS